MIFWKLNQTEEQAAQAPTLIMDKEAHLLLMERKEAQIAELGLAIDDCKQKLELAKQDRDAAIRVLLLYKAALGIITILGLIGWAV